MHDMTLLDHSPLGGSSTHRFMRCTGSFVLHRELIESGDFEQIESEYANLGTAAHALAAQCLIQEREPFEFIGQEFEGYAVGTPEGINPNAVAVYVNECERILAPRDGKGTKLIETTMKHPEVHPLLKGTIDFGFWSTKRGLYLRDYKNGEGIGVSAVGNEQLLYYAFLMVLEYPWLRDGPKDFPMNLGIVQPNFYGVFEEADVWNTTLGHVMQWGQEVLVPRMNFLTLVQDIGLDDFVSGEHCQFCPVLLECPRMQKAFEEYAKAPVEFVTMLEDKELDHFYSLREDARRFMKVLEDTVRHRKLTNPDADIPSAKVVEKKVARVWKPEAEVALRTAFGDAAYAPRKVKSPAVIEKMSSRGKEMVLELSYKPGGDQLTVAPLSDKRKEVKGTQSQRVFANFESKHW